MNTTWDTLEDVYSDACETQFEKVSVCSKIAWARDYWEAVEERRKKS